MTLWTLKNPHELPMLITLREDGMVKAEFPALPGCMAIGRGKNLWIARDMAILGCAQAIVRAIPHFTGFDGIAAEVEEI